MARRTNGFTAIEIVIVLVVAGILLGMAVPAIGRAQARQGALNARNALVMLGARARSVAIERGAAAELKVDAAAGRAWVEIAGNAVESVDYSGEFDADVRIASGSGGLCVRYDPRGLGGTCGPSSPTLPDTVIFTRGAYTARAVVRFLGQVSKS